MNQIFFLISINYYNEIKLLRNKWLLFSLVFPQIFVGQKIKNLKRKIAKRI